MDRPITCRKLMTEAIVDERKACPACAEQIMQTARVCRYCGHALDPEFGVANDSTARTVSLWTLLGIVALVAAVAVGAIHLLSASGAAAKTVAPRRTVAKPPLAVRAENALAAHFGSTEYVRDVHNRMLIDSIDLSDDGFFRASRAPFTNTVHCVHEGGNRYGCTHHIVSKTGAYEETTNVEADYDAATGDVIVADEHTSDGHPYP